MFQYGVTAATGALGMERYNAFFPGMHMNKPNSKPEDHRTRVGLARREKTRIRLMRSALAVFAEKGPDLPVIDDFIAAAGVARGTFYNYFNTTSELLVAVTSQMSDEVLSVVDLEVLKFNDPAVRVTTGTRLYVRMAREYSAWGRFLTRVGSARAVRGKLLDTYLTRDVELGVSMGRFSVDNPQAIRDVILGSIFYGIETMLMEPCSETHVEEMMAAVLHGIGLTKKEAHKIAFMPLVETGPVPGPIFSALTEKHR